MTQVIIFPNDDGSIALMRVVSEHAINETAKRDVPLGKPYLIVNESELPVQPQEVWRCDFTSPNGYGERKI